VRESDALALSSRNAYLDEPAASRGASLYRALLAAREAIEQGYRDSGSVRAAALARIEEPLELEVS